ncbi:cyclin-dependent kinase 10-like [Uloborus diversus]|uniref:cyclin-dependent kinase 10-like n=1 Tax=Uloborus diversus TaxID=327109 RepID=UPI0024096FD7|nr:cyclin-dependent kinase 10-like [Uloborus diversus]XP_054714390.1 cyclin-dependent kinase 10-like [Uloborus diversus]
MAIPGLSFPFPTQTDNSSDLEDIVLTGFDLKRFVVPDFHRYGKCRPVTDFHKICKFGEGTFGTVYKVKDKRTDEVVALKKLKIHKESECMPLNFTREIIILKELKHKNIVNLHGVAVGKSIESTYLILEYCSFVLSNVIDEVDTASLLEPQIKCIMSQLFKGLDYIHKHFVIHRDLNPTNILFTQGGILKISDFGCSCKASSGDLSPHVVSRWYRPPEILFGSTKYTYTVDIWSSGCVFSELLLRNALFRGDSDTDVIRKIVDCLGTPTEDTWPGFTELPLLKDYDIYLQPVNRLRSFFEKQTIICHSLLERIFFYNPETRYSAEQCMNHEYFLEKPLACAPDLLLPILIDDLSSFKHYKPIDGLSYTAEAYM